MNFTNTSDHLFLVIFKITEYMYEIIL